MTLNELEIPAPEAAAGMLTALDLFQGMPLPPIDRLETMDSGSWEKFTLELVTNWKSQYKKVTRCGGGGDMGRDVIAFMDDGWENFQCKYYADKLSVADAILEVGKVIYYSLIGEYTFPNKYYFVSPKGCSTDLIKVLSDKTGNKMKDQLLARWDKSCKDSITKKKSIELDSDLMDYISNVDFTIFDDIEPLKLIELHSKTPYHAIRFGTYRIKRPVPQKAPENIDWATEQTYIQALLDAFSQYKSIKIDVSSLAGHSNLSKEMISARNNFYSADALDRFSRDWLPPDSFYDLKEECHEGISATINMAYKDGYERYLSTSESAVKISYTSHPLSPYMKVQDRKGLCHHLINDDVFSWIGDDSE